VEVTTYNTLIFGDLFNCLIHHTSIVAIAMPALAHVTYLHCCGGEPHASMDVAQIDMMPSQVCPNSRRSKMHEDILFIRLGVGV
jgi:hypothetical protein